MDKKKIGIVLCSYGLPVPAVKGGAVEQLLTMIHEENEKKGRAFLNFYIPIKSKKMVKELDLDKKYKNAKFCYIVTNRFANFCVKAINKFARLIFKKNILTDCFYNKAYKALKRDKNDFILFEGDYPLNIQKYIKKFGKEKLGFHIHCQFVAEKHGADKYTQKFVTSPKTGIQNFGKVLCVSHFIKKDWEDIYAKYGYDKSNLYYYRNAVDETRFTKEISQQERAEIRASLGFSEQDFVCTFCGRISAIKGIKELMQAIIELNQDNIKLLIMGSVNFDTQVKTPYLKEVEELCTQNPNKIKFTGYVKNSQVYKYLKSTETEVIPSIWNDAAPLTALEARWAGLPIIVTRSGGLPEHSAQKTIIIERDENIVENLKKAILMWQKNKKAYAEARQDTTNNIEKFGKDAFYNNFIKLMNGEKIND